MLIQAARPSSGCRRVERNASGPPPARCNPSATRDQVLGASEIVKYVTASCPLQDPGGQGGFPHPDTPHPGRRPDACKPYLRSGRRREGKGRGWPLLRVLEFRLFSQNRVRSTTKKRSHRTLRFCRHRVTTGFWVRSCAFSSSAGPLPWQFESPDSWWADLVHLAAPTVAPFPVSHPGRRGIGFDRRRDD
jgi:hypothetical protein